MRKQCQEIGHNPAKRDYWITESYCLKKGICWYCGEDTAAPAKVTPPPAPQGAKEIHMPTYDDDLTPMERTHARLSAADQHTPAPTTAQAQVTERNHEEDDWRITQAIRADKQGRSWHVGERESGSISVFYTRMEVNGHYVVYDTSESHPLSAPQQQADGRVVRGALEAAQKWLNDFGANSPILFGGEQTLADKLAAALAELDGPK